MNRISFWTLVALFGWLSASSLDVWAELPSSPQKDLKLSTAPPPPTPLPEPSVSEKDADRLAAEIGQRERDEIFIRKEILEPHRRPDLEYDVVNGIQSRNANKALGRR